MNSKKKPLWIEAINQVELDDDSEAPNENG